MPSTWIAKQFAPLVVIATALSAQAWPARATETSAQWFAADAGLTEATQNDIDVAPDGTIWLATSVGLVSFNGVEWTRYGTAQGLPSACITTVKLSDGVLWVGTDRGAGTWHEGRFEPGPQGLRDVFVRRIVERVRGELWIATAQATWTRREGQLTAAADLAVRDLVALDDGSVLAITEGELVLWTGEQNQTLPLPSGVNPGTCANAFARGRDGRLVAVTRHGPRVLSRAGAWTQYSGALHAGVDSALLRRSDGEVVMMTGPWPRLWRLGLSLEPLSEDTSPIGCGAIRRMIEAPDGAVWVVGEGTVLRWPRADVTRYDVPAPVCEDQHGRVWFADAAAVVWHREGTWQREPQLTTPLVRRNRGDILACWRDGAAIAVIGAVPRLVPLPKPSAAPLHLLVDGRDVAWLYGRDGDASWLAWLEQDHHWRLRQLGAVTADALLAADPHGGVWVLDRASSRLVHVTEDAAEFMALPESLACETLAVTPHGQVWMVGRSGLWHARRGAAFTPFGTRWAHAAQWLTTTGDRVVVENLGSPTQQGGFGVLDDGTVANVVARSPRVVGRDGRGLYLAAADHVYLVPPRGAPTVVPECALTPVSTLVIDSHNNAWVGSPAGMRCIPALPAPELVLHAPAADEGETITLAAALVYRFRPRLPAALPVANVEWRAGEGPWQHAVLSGSVHLPALAAGTHRIELRARDALGRAAAVSDTIVRVRAMPLTERWWAPLLGGALALAFCGFAAQRWVRSRRLLVRAHHLEHRIGARTERVRRELHRRAQAERCLSQQHRVLAMLSQGQPLTEALAALVEGLEQQLPGWHAAVSIALAERGTEHTEDVSSPGRVSLPTPAEPAPSGAVVTAALWWEDPRYRGLGPVHAQPIVASDGTTLGVLAVASRASAELTPVQRRAIEGAARIAAIAIEAKRGEAERHELQRQILNAQQLRSLGLLTGGIAHDFNNLLTGILGNAGLARMTTTVGSSEDGALVQVELAAQRAADLCAQLLAYSGSGRFIIKSVNLSLLVQEMVQMLRLPMARKVALHLALEPNLPAIEADATQLRQVVMNLMTNAAEAVGDRPGEINLSTGVVELCAERLRGAAVRGNATPGRFVFVAVADTGCGMSAATRQRMFDPFFTTKITGRGLGLAAVLDIVRGHHGAIEIESEPGAGTRIRVFFPATSQPVEVPRPAAPARQPAIDGGGRILLVEDEPIVHQVARTVMLGAGFEVDSVRDVDSALARLSEGANFRLMLLDAVLPGLTHSEVLCRVRRLCPDLPIVLSSVTADDAVGDSRLLHLHHLKKPYGPQALLEAISRALRVPPPRQSTTAQLSSRS